MWFVDHHVMHKFHSRPGMHLLWVFGVGMLWAFQGQAVYAQQVDNLAQRFLTEAPPAWEKYRSFAESLDGTVNVLAMRGQTTLDEGRFRYNHNASCRMAEELPVPPGQPVARLSATNQRYSFSLARKASGRPWVVTGLDMHVPDENSIAQTVWTQRTPLRALIRVFSEDLQDLLRQPTFRVVRAGPVRRNGLDLVRVDFENPHPANAAEHVAFPIQGGTLFLDPARCWCLREATLHNRYNGGDAVITIQTFVADPASPLPIPSRTVENKDYHNSHRGRLLSTVTTTFDLHETSALPDDAQFTLSAFGFPEPLGDSSSSTRTYIWVGLGGLCCLAVAVLVRRLSRRSPVAV